jgi:hypothetical protein
VKVRVKRTRLTHSAGSSNVFVSLLSCRHSFTVEVQRGRQRGVIVQGSFDYRWTDEAGLMRPAGTPGFGLPRCHMNAKISPKGSDKKLSDLDPHQIRYPRQKK